MPVLYCRETPGLKLGPNGADDPDTIVFRDGWADVAEITPTIAEWIAHPGTPHIEIIDDAEGRVSETTVGAEVCPECGKAFDSKRKLQGHLLSHRTR